MSAIEEHHLSLMNELFFPSNARVFKVFLPQIRKIQEENLHFDATFSSASFLVAPNVTLDSLHAKLLAGYHEYLRIVCVIFIHVQLKQSDRGSFGS